MILQELLLYQNLHWSVGFWFRFQLLLLENLVVLAASPQESRDCNVDSLVSLLVSLFKASVDVGYRFLDRETIGEFSVHYTSALLVKV